MKNFPISSRLACHLPPNACHLSSAICHLPSAIYRLPSAIYRLLSTACTPLTPPPVAAATGGAANRQVCAGVPEDSDGVEVKRAVQLLRSALLRVCGPRTYNRADRCESYACNYANRYKQLPLGQALIRAAAKRQRFSVEMRCGSTD